VDSLIANQNAGNLFLLGEADGRWEAWEHYSASCDLARGRLSRGLTGRCPHPPRSDLGTPRSECDGEVSCMLSEFTPSIVAAEQDLSCRCQGRDVGLCEQPCKEQLPIRGRNGDIEKCELRIVGWSVQDELVSCQGVSLGYARARLTQGIQTRSADMVH
jgi:hypothetical protein